LGITSLADKAAGERRSAVGARLLQHPICQPTANQRLHLPAQSPKADLNVQQRHSAAAEVQDSGALFGE
jgi:hypothetical protein